MSTNPDTTNPQGEPRQEEEQSSFFTKLMKYLLIFYIVSSVTKYFQKNNTQIPGLSNILSNGTLLNVDFYISPRLVNYHKLKQLTPIHTIKNITYLYPNESYDKVTHEGMEVNITIDTSNFPEVNKNASLYLYADIRPSNAEEAESVMGKFGSSHGVFTQSLNLFQYIEDLSGIIRQSDMMNDVESASYKQDDTRMIGENETNLNETITSLYYSPDIYFYLITMNDREELTTFEELRIMGHLNRLNYQTNIFAPSTYLTDFWTMTSELQPVKRSKECLLNLSLNFKYLTNFFLKQMKGIEINDKFMKDKLEVHGSRDILVELIKNNSMTYLSIIFTVNILHTLFSVLGFASDISYYKNLKNLDGVYTKYIFFNMFHMLITFIYITIQGANFLVKVELFVSAAVEVWKLRKIFSVNFDRVFPFVHVSYKINFKQEKSRDFENEAVKLTMKYIFTPVAILYLSYRIYYYNNKKTLVIFVIEYIYFLLSLFGFVLLTPQIYLNYKLKSVEHLPFKALTFKFLNTIIDDLYAFAVKTPTLYRIFCFKDDVIFVIYIIQVCLYKKKRIDDSNEGEGNNLTPTTTHVKDQHDKLKTS